LSEELLQKLELRRGFKCGVEDKEGSTSDHVVSSELELVHGVHSRKLVLALQFYH
jgi:hypothetical protein